MIEKIEGVLSSGSICDSCLGRQSAELLSGMTNAERGRIIRHYVAMLIDSGEKIDVDISNFYGIKFRNAKIKPEKPGQCKVCKNFFLDEIDKLAERVVKKLEGIEFDNFLVGTIASDGMTRAEEKLWGEAGIEFVEPIKSEINRELGKRIERLTKKRFKLSNPDVTIIVDLNTDRIRMQIKSLLVSGGYKKLMRGISQTKWICGSCGGKGCKACKGSGKLYKTSVQEEIEKPLIKATKAKKGKFHGCISENANVFLNDFSFPVKELESIWKSHKVITYDTVKGKLYPTKIIDFIKLNPKSIGLETFEVTTKETGRKLICTYDHPLFTPKGMVPLHKLKSEDKVAVYPIQVCKEMSYNKEEVIVAKEDILKTINKYAPTSFKLKILKELEEKNFLPLTTKNKRLPKLVRLAGFIFGDGTAWITRNRDVILSFYGDRKNLENIKSDIVEMNFKVSPIRTRKGKGSKVLDYYGNERSIEGTGSSLTCYSKSLWMLLVALGAPVGNKTITKSAIPSWIKQSNYRIKKEFLSALFGSDMDKPRLDRRKYNKKSFSTPRFSINKLEDLIKNGIKYIEEIRELLKEFGVETLKPRRIPYTTRKDGRKTFKICLDISNRFENLLNLYGKIGYAYCDDREEFSKYVTEYFTMKKKVVDLRKETYKKVLELKRKGMPLMQIFKKLGNEWVNYKNLALWLSPKNNKFTNIKAPNNFPNFDDWLKASTKKLKGGLVWETIESIKRVNAQFVYDLTTKSSSHTFFANGFLVSNSGREDVDARCLDYRPFVIELVRPLRRKVSLAKLAAEINKSKKVKVSWLKHADKEYVRRIKTMRQEKTYLAEVTFAKDIDKKKIKALKQLIGQISQKTPLRVVHRRADKLRRRAVKSINAKIVGRKKMQLRIRAESGLYIKELITGDTGRTKVNVSDLLGNKVKKISLDVIKIHK